MKKNIRSSTILTAVLVSSVMLLSGCQKEVDSVKVDPVALQRVEKAVAAYQKLVVSFSASGLTTEEFRNQTNEADFLLRDAIKFLEAKGIKEDIVGGESLTIIADKLGEYRKFYNDADERARVLAPQYGKDADTTDLRYFTSARHNLPNPECKEVDSGWITPGPEWTSSRLEIFGPAVLIGMAKKLPELKLLYKDEKNYWVKMPDDVMQELLNYEPTEQEPKAFLTHFEKYCKEGKYGFKFNSETEKYDTVTFYPRYGAIFCASLRSVQSAAVSEIRKIVDKLDTAVKKLQ
jgi:hypothetical protein